MSISKWAYTPEVCDGKYCVGDCDRCSLIATIDVLMEDNKFTAADVVEVVRCKDCKYWQDNNGGYPNQNCRWLKDETPDADDYCSYGERKEENELKEKRRGG